MNTEIVCALIAVTGTLVSAVISFWVSKFSAEKEIQKMKLEWKRQDIVSSDEDFSDMAVAVSRFIQMQTSKTHADVVAAVTKIRAKEFGTIADDLDALYATIGRRGAGYSPNREEIDRLLSEILKQKRDAKRAQ